MNAIAANWNAVVRVSGGPICGTTAGRVWAMPARKTRPEMLIRREISGDEILRRCRAPS